MKKMTIIAFFMLFISNMQAQPGVWQVIMQKPSVTFFDLQFLQEPLLGFAVGNQGGGGNQLSAIFKTTEGGTSWDQLPFSFATGSSLNGVYFVNKDTGWVVGSNGFIARTMNGGQSWIQQNSNTTRKLQRVQFLSDTEGWITGGWNDGSGYLLLHTINGGTTWQNVSFGSDAYSCDDIYFTDPLNGWICGLDNAITGHIHHTTDGGITWERQTIPYTGVTGVRVASLDFATNQKGWASISSLYVSPAGPILYTEDAGETWNVQTTTGMAYNDCIDVRDSLNVAVIGVNILQPASEKVFVTSNGGQTWNSNNLPIINYTYGVQYVGNKIWACSNNSQVVYSSNNGNTWSIQHIAPYLKSLAWSNPQTGWAVAGSNVGTDSWTYKSVDGGTTWNTDPTAPGGSKVQFIGPSNGWMLHEGNNAKVYRTTDGGGSWIQAGVGTSSWTGGLFFSSVDSGWIFGSNGNLRSSINGGSSWSSQSVGSSNYVEDVYFVNSQLGWAGGGYGGGSGFISRSDNGGLNWSLQTYPGSEHVLSVFFLDEQQGWASTVGGNVYKTSNGGLTWVSAGQIPQDFPDEILFISSSIGWAAANSANNQGFVGYIYKTTNGGNSWVLEYSSQYAYSTITDLCLGLDNFLWACGGHSTILNYQIPLSVEENEIRTSYELTVTPNPSNGPFDIQFLNSKNEKVSLDLYSITGEKIDQIYDGWAKEGSNSFHFNPESNGKQLSSGLYILRLVSSSGSLSHKVLISR